MLLLSYLNSFKLSRAVLHTILIMTPKDVYWLINYMCNIEKLENLEDWDKDKINILNVWLITVALYFNISRKNILGKAIN